MNNRDGKRGTNDGSPFLFSDQGKRFHEKAIKAQQESEANSTLHVEGNTTANVQSEQNISSLSIWQASYAAWCRRHWQNFRVNVLGLEGSSGEE